MQISAAFCVNTPALEECVQKSAEGNAGCSPGVVPGSLSESHPALTLLSCNVTTLCPLARTFSNFVVRPQLIMLPSSLRVWHRHG